MAALRRLDSGQRNRQKQEVKIFFMLSKPTFLIATFISMQSLAFSMPPEIEAKFNNAMRDWKTYPAETLKRPENAALLAELKAYVLAHPYDAVGVILINKGDQEVIVIYLARFRGPVGPEYMEAAVLLGHSTNPDIITLVGDDLNRDESPKWKLVGEHSIFTPHSVLAARIIKEVIKNSNEFSPEMKKWTAKLGYAGKTLREPVKKWWNDNETLILAKQYSKLRPPAP